MATSNNYLSLLFAFWGSQTGYKTFPVFQDLDANQILFIRLQTVKALDGADVPAFVVTAQDRLGVNQIYYWITTDDFVASLAALQTLLNSTSTQNSFTLYTNLQKVQNFEVFTTGESILISDLHCTGRIYNVGDDSTVITTDSPNNLIYTQITVDGDQTTSALYYYNVYNV